jgi:type VI secretion system protein VasI|tara:strand:- start:300 stop:890 length:591 start_codon:yes stop_codon:yes gene_type:complete
MALVLSANAFGQADSINKRLAKCAAIEGDLERLECFDQLTRELGLVATTNTVAVEGSGKWNVRIDSNPLDDSKTVVLVLVADEGSSQWGRPVVLIIRCKSNSTEVYITWNDYLGSEARVTTRIGSSKAQSSYWSLSTDSQATFYQDNRIAFVKQLMRADKFVAQVTPYNESPVTAVFDIRGLSEAIKPLQETCGWE